MTIEDSFELITQLDTSPSAYLNQYNLDALAPCLPKTSHLTPNYL